MKKTYRRKQHDVVTTRPKLQIISLPGFSFAEHQAPALPSPVAGTSNSNRHGPTITAP